MLKVLLILSVLYYEDAFGLSIGRSILSRIQFPSATMDSFQWSTDRGSFRFGMQGKDQWRIEKRYPDGRVFVRFAYRTPDGEVVDNSFTRGKLSKHDREESGLNDNEENEKYSPYDIMPNENIELYSTNEAAMPYGALSGAFQKESNFNEVSIDKESKAAVLSLN